MAGFRDVLGLRLAPRAVRLAPDTSEQNFCDPSGGNPAALNLGHEQLKLLIKELLGSRKCSASPTSGAEPV